MKERKLSGLAPPIQVITYHDKLFGATFSCWYHFFLGANNWRGENISDISTLGVQLRGELLLPKAFCMGIPTFAAKKRGELFLAEGFFDGYHYFSTKELATIFVKTLFSCTTSCMCTACVHVYCMCVCVPHICMHQCMHSTRVWWCCVCQTVSNYI